MTYSPDTQNPPDSGISPPIRKGASVARKRLWIWRALVFILPVFVIFGAVGGVIAMGALKPTPDEKEDIVKAIPVITAIATQDDVTLKVNVQGEAQPRTQINLVPQVSGLITFMAPSFIEGGRFRKGDLLARVDSAEFELRVIQAKSDVVQAQTTITREASEAAIARRDWDELGLKGKPTPLTLREPQMAQAQAQLESAKARLAEAELQLSRTSLYAPFTGRVMTRLIDQGEFVTAGTRLGEVYATNIIDVRLPMTNEDLRRAGINLGFEANRTTQGVPVTLSANVGGIYSEWQSRIIRTDSRFDTNTRVLFVYAEVQDPFGVGASNGVPLAPGIFVNAAIAGQQLEDTIIIPRSALRGADKVYLAQDDTLSIQSVNVISSNKTHAILGSGIEVGDAVITSPIRGVVDGMKIAAIKPENTPLASSVTEGDK